MAVLLHFENYRPFATKAAIDLTALTARRKAAPLQSKFKLVQHRDDALWIRAAGQIESCVHQADVREGLRKITQLTFCDWIILFGQKTNIISDVQQTLE
jgi:hypothetical protein